MEEVDLVNAALQLPRTVAIKDLKKRYKYPIIEWRGLKTRYGRAVMVTLIDGEEHVNAFLPKHVAYKISDELIYKLNNRPNVYLNFLGMDDNEKYCKIQIIK